MKYPPCKVCRHSKAKHGTIQLSHYVGYRKHRKIVDVPSCQDCWNFIVYGPTYDWEYNIVNPENGFAVENKHSYEPDNLLFLEHKSRRFDEKNKVKNGLLLPTQTV